MSKSVTEIGEMGRGGLMSFYQIVLCAIFIFGDWDDDDSVFSIRLLNRQFCTDGNSWRVLCKDVPRGT